METDDDPVAQRLREAVWADPEPDAPRMVYADYLQEQGDPLGELIALQLERARTGAAVSDRERTLVTEHGPRMHLPHTAACSLARGFLSEAWAVNGMATEDAHHRAWSTVEQLGADDAAHAIFDNPQLRARRFHAHPRVCQTLARRGEALPFRALADHTRHSGLLFQDFQLDVFEHAGAFDHVRVLSAVSWVFERQLAHVRASRLFLQLEHLDVTFHDIDLDELVRWRTLIEGTHLSRSSAHIPLATTYVELPSDPDSIDESVARGRHEPSAFAYIEVERAGDELIIQPDFEPGTPLSGDVVAVMKAVAGTRPRVIVEAHGDREELCAVLRGGFDDVSVRPPRRRAP